MALSPDIAKCVRRPDLQRNCLQRLRPPKDTNHSTGVMHGFSRSHPPRTHGGPTARRDTKRG